MLPFCFCLNNQFALSNKTAKDVISLRVSRIKLWSINCSDDIKLKYTSYFYCP